MKAPPTFWLLLKHQLALGQTGGAWPVAGLLLVCWLIVAALPLLVLFGQGMAHGNVASLFQCGVLPVFAFLFLICLTLSMTYATVPAFCDLLPPENGVRGSIQKLAVFEFLFTRAVDRRLLFRARMTAFAIMVLAPLFLSLAVSPLAPDISFGPSDSTSAEALARHERYLAAFPASHPRVHAAIVPGELIIPHGAVAYAAWVACSGTFAYLLLQAYGTLIARRVKPNIGWTSLLPAAPILVLLISLAVLVRSSFDAGISFFEISFLLFSTHLLQL